MLDSGALSHFAKGPRDLAAWIEQVEVLHDQPMFFVPSGALTEALTGNPRLDANMHRLLNRLAPSDDLDLLVLDASFPVANRAAALRTRAITSGAATTKRPISVTDAQLVALAEERSIVNAVTILTSDPADIRLLVELTGATNIAVQVV